MAQNIDILDFTLTADDMAQIAKMNQHDAGTTNFGDSQFAKYLIEITDKWLVAIKKIPKAICLWDFFFVFNIVLR